MAFAHRAWAVVCFILVVAARVDARSLRRPSPIGARRTTLLDDEFHVDSFDVVDSKSEAVATRSILRDASSGEWSKWRYRSNDELAATLDDLHAGPCAGISKLTTIGTSAGGVAMRAMEISTSPGLEQAKPGIMLVGNMHGDEPVGRELIVRFARLLCIAHGGKDRSSGAGDLDEASKKLVDEAASIVDGARVFLVPTINPDGFKNKRRNNGNSKDLNRDFPDQFNDPSLPDGFDERQPETAAIMRYSQSVNATAALNFHEGALVANYPYDAISGTNRQAGYAKSPDDVAFKRLAKIYAKAHPSMATPANKEFPEGVTNGAKWYPLWGGMQDWHYIKTQTMDVTVEVNERKWPEAGQLSNLWSEHAPAIVSYVHAVTRKSLTGKVLDSADGISPVASAQLSVAGIDVPFIASSLGYYARFLAPGTHEVTASAPGYYSQTRSVTVDAESGGTLTISLRRLEDETPDTGNVQTFSKQKPSRVVETKKPVVNRNSAVDTNDPNYDPEKGGIVWNRGEPDEWVDDGTTTLDVANARIVYAPTPEGYVQPWGQGPDIGFLDAIVVALIVIGVCVWRWRKRRKARLAALREGVQLSNVKVTND